MMLADWARFMSENPKWWTLWGTAEGFARAKVYWQARKAVLLNGVYRAISPLVEPTRNAALDTVAQPSAPLTSEEAAPQGSPA